MIINLFHLLISDTTPARTRTSCTSWSGASAGNRKHTAEHRWAEHLGYVRNRRLDQATGAHFNLPGHNIGHMTFSVLEKIKNNNPQYRKARESHFIEKFNLKYAGMNVKR